MINLLIFSFCAFLQSWANDTSTDLSLANKPSLSSSESAGSTATAVPAQPHWRLNFSSYYYAFQGERGAVTNLYDFDKITSRMDFFNLNYVLPQNWSLNILLQHFDSYIETKFPAVENPLWKQSNDTIRGFSDTYITLIAPIKMGYPIVVTADVGVSIPTGAIDFKAVNLPGLESINLAYNAQLGSGTVDGLAGLTFLYLQPQYQAGSRLFANFRTGRNDFEYRLGNQYRLDMWFDYSLPMGLTPRLAGYYRFKEGIRGFDSTRGNNPADNFFFNKQINWDISAALRYQKALWATKLALSAELGVPIAQDNINVDSTFVRTLYYVSLGLNSTF